MAAKVDVKEVPKVRASGTLNTCISNAQKAVKLRLEKRYELSNLFEYGRLVSCSIELKRNLAGMSGKK